MIIYALRLKVDILVTHIFHLTMNLSENLVSIQILPTQPTVFGWTLIDRFWMMIPQMPCKPCPHHPEHSELRVDVSIIQAYWYHFLAPLSTAKISFVRAVFRNRCIAFESMSALGHCLEVENPTPCYFSLSFFCLTTMIICVIFRQKYFPMVGGGQYR